MGKKKKKSELEMEYQYMQALRGKEVPLLTLDAGWHRIFPDFRKTGEIKKLEKELNQFIKQQGQTEHDLKDYDKAKKVIMNNIVENKTDGHEPDSPIRIKKQEKNQQFLIGFFDLLWKLSPQLFGFFNLFVQIRNQLLIFFLFFNTDRAILEDVRSEPR